MGDKFKTTIDNFCYSISGCKKRQGSPSSLAEKDKNAFEGGEAEDETEKVAIPLVNVATAKNDTQTGELANNGTAKTNQCHNQVLIHGMYFVVFY